MKIILKKPIIKIVSTIAILYLLLFVLALIFGSSPGKISKDLVIDYGTSEKFTQEEIDSAMTVIMEYFESYTDCTLLKLYYNENFYNSVHGDNTDIIYIGVEFKTGRNPDSCWGKNSLYDKGAFYLRRSDDSKTWIFQGWGTC